MAVYINPQDAVKLGLLYERGASSEEMQREIAKAADRYRATHPKEKSRTNEGKLAKELD
jgi:hypothetical protein